MKSLPTISDYYAIQRHNEDKFMNTLKLADPELYMVKECLTQTGINPLILPQFIRALYLLAIGAKYGKVTTFMQNGVITAIKSEESNLLNYVTIEVRNKEIERG